MTASNDLNISEAGYVVFDGTSTFHGRTFQAGAGISITNGNGVSGDTTIALSGGGQAIDQVAVQTGTSPVAPDGNGQITINGAVVSAGTNPVRSDGTGANTLAVEVQISQAIAATDATKIGLSNFNSANFTVDANGFVGLNATGFPWTDVTSATQTLAINNGYVTNRGGGVTYTLPATATEGDMIRISGKSGAWSIAQNANQQIGVSSSSSTVGAGGSIASTDSGDCIELLCTTSGASTRWRAISFVGNLTVT